MILSMARLLPHFSACQDVLHLFLLLLSPSSLPELKPIASQFGLSPRPVKEVYKETEAL